MPERLAQIRHLTKVTTMEVGEKRKVRINVKNVGTEAWAGGSYELVPVDTDHEGIIVRVQRWVKKGVNIARRVEDNGSLKLSFKIEAPKTAKTYNYRWQVKPKKGRRIGRASKADKVRVTKNKK